MTADEKTEQPPPYHLVSASTEQTPGCLARVGRAFSGVFAPAASNTHNKDKPVELVESVKSVESGYALKQSYSSSSLSSNEDTKAQYTYAGNFTTCSSDIQLRGNGELVANCRTDAGTMKQSSIQLNNLLENVWGKFTWQRGGNFMATARNVRLTKGGRYLEAELGNGTGVKDHARIRLDERIANNNGNLVFVPKTTSIKKAL